MRVDREEFQYWVGVVDRIAPSGKISTNIQKSVIIRSPGDNKCHILSNSGYHAVEIDGINCVCEEPFEVAVETKALYHACVGDSDDVDLKINDAMLDVTVGKHVYHIPLENFADFSFPDPATVDHGVIKKGTLVNLFELSKPMLSADQTVPHLMGVLLKEKYIYATDMSGAVRFTCDEFNFDEDINFMPEAIIEVLKTGGEDDTPVEVITNDEWICFKAGPIKLFSHRWSLGGEYQTVDIDNELSSAPNNVGKLKINRESLDIALDRVSYFCTNDIVRLIVGGKGVMRVDVVDKKRVVASAPVSGLCQVSEETAFLLDIKHLRALISCDAETLELCVGSATDTFYMKHKNSEYIILPAV